MRRILPPTLLLVATLLIAACGSAVPLLSGRGTAGNQPLEPIVGESLQMEAPMPSAVDSSAAAGGDASLQIESVQDRLVVRNANLSVVVQDPAASVDSISSMAEGMGGYVVSSNVYETTFGDSRLSEPITAKQASITIRVPSEQLEAALEQIKNNAVEVRNQNVSGQDVTEEFTDLQSQLDNLEAAEAELREIMDSASRRDRIEDVLAVLNQLRQVRQEIEVIQGRIQYLQESAKLSSISVDLIPDVATQPLQIGRWTPQGTAREAVAALIEALKWLADLAIWGLICVLPIAALLGVPAWIAFRAIWRRRRARKATEVKDVEEESAS
jgi:hypothetical protein